MCLGTGTRAGLGRLVGCKRPPPRLAIARRSALPTEIRNLWLLYEIVVCRYRIECTHWQPEPALLLDTAFATRADLHSPPVRRTPPLPAGSSINKKATWTV